MTDTATIEPAIEESHAVAPAVSANRVAKLTKTAGTMKKNRPSANPHQKPASRASRSSRARCWIPSPCMHARGGAGEGRPPKSPVQQHERHALEYVVDCVVVEVGRVNRDPTQST